MTSELFILHKSLITHSSVTGNEHSCSQFLASYLRSKGWSVELQNCAPNRDNVFAYLHNNRNVRLILNSHLDVVPPYVEYREDNENIYGRGSCDAKGSVAAQIMAAEDLKKEGVIKEGDIGLLYVVGEETDHIGMIKASDHKITPEFLIVGEPTESLLALGHKGIIKFLLRAHGKAAHSGYPELGISAIDLLIDTLHAIKNINFPDDPKLGPTTVNIGIISGGVAANVIPASAEAEVMVRVATSVDNVWELIEKVVSGRKEIEAIRTTSSEPVKCEVVDGFQTGVMKYNTDIAFLQGTRKNYLYGPGSIQVAHVQHEFVSKDELAGAVGGYKKLVRALLTK